MKKRIFAGLCIIFLILASGIVNGFREPSDLIEIKENTWYISKTRNYRYIRVDDIIYARNMGASGNARLIKQTDTAWEYATEQQEKDVVAAAVQNKAEPGEWARGDMAGIGHAWDYTFVNDKVFARRTVGTPQAPEYQYAEFVGGTIRTPEQEIIPLRKIAETDFQRELKIATNKFNSFFQQTADYLEREDYAGLESFIEKNLIPSAITDEGRAYAYAYLSESQYRQNKIEEVQENFRKAYSYDSEFLEEAAAIGVFSNDPSIREVGVAIYGSIYPQIEDENVRKEAIAALGRGLEDDNKGVRAVAEAQLRDILPPEEFQRTMAALSREVPEAYETREPGELEPFAGRAATPQEQAVSSDSEIRKKAFEHYRQNPSDLQKDKESATGALAEALAQIEREIFLVGYGKRRGYEYVGNGLFKKGDKTYAYTDKGFVESTTPQTPQEIKDADVRAKVDAWNAAHPNDQIKPEDGKLVDQQGNEIEFKGLEIIRTPPATIPIDDKQAKITSYQTPDGLYVYTSEGKYYSQTGKELKEGDEVHRDKSYGKGDNQITLREIYAVDDEGRISTAVTGTQIHQEGKPSIDIVDPAAIPDIRNLVRNGGIVTGTANDFTITRDGQLIGSVLVTTKEGVTSTTIGSGYKKSADGRLNEPASTQTYFSHEEKGKQISDSIRTEEFAYTYTYQDEKGDWHRVSEEDVEELIEEGINIVSNRIHTRDYAWARSEDKVSWRDSVVTNWHIDPATGRETSADIDVYENGKLQLNKYRYAYVRYVDRVRETYTVAFDEEGYPETINGERIDPANDLHMQINDVAYDNYRTHRRAIQFSAFEDILTEFQGLSYYSPYWLGADAVNEWKTAMDKFFTSDVLGIFFGGVDYWASALCENQYETQGDDVFYYVTPDGQLVQVAHVEGERSSAVELPNGTKEYFYKITFSAKTTYDDNAFIVYLVKPNRDTKNLFTAKIELKGDPSGQGESYYATGANTIVKYSRNLYNEVCIKFDNSISIGRNFFAGAAEKNTLCNPIEVSDDSYTNYVESGEIGGGETEEEAELTTDW